MAAVRVPPSAWRTWQSMAMVWGPILEMSMAARRARPMRRWISVPRESVWPILGQGLRVGVEEGSMRYSAVIQPPGLLSGNQGGTSWVMEAVARTMVSPCCQRTEPAGVLVKLRVILIGRISVGERIGKRIQNSQVRRQKTLTLPSPGVPGEGMIEGTLRGGI